MITPPRCKRYSFVSKAAVGATGGDAGESELKSKIQTLEDEKREALARSQQLERKVHRLTDSIVHLKNQALLDITRGDEAVSFFCLLSHQSRYVYIPPSRDPGRPVYAGEQGKSRGCLEKDPGYARGHLPARCGAGQGE